MAAPPAAGRADDPAHRVPPPADDPPPSHRHLGDGRRGGCARARHRRHGLGARPLRHPACRDQRRRRLRGRPVLRVGCRERNRRRRQRHRRHHDPHRHELHVGCGIRSISTVVAGSGDETVTYYVADVMLSDATVLRSAFAGNQFGENITETTSQIAADNGAIFAINGDYYGFRDTGIVIRNGVVYRDEGAREGLAFYADGTVAVYDETAVERRRTPRRRGVEHALVRPGGRGGRRRSSTASRRSRSTRTSATTRSRATSPARRSA